MNGTVQDRLMHLKLLRKAEARNIAILDDLAKNLNLATEQGLSEPVMLRRIGGPPEDFQYNLASAVANGAEAIWAHLARFTVETLQKEWPPAKALGYIASFLFNLETENTGGIGNNLVVTMSTNDKWPAKDPLEQFMKSRFTTVTESFFHAASTLQDGDQIDSGIRLTTEKNVHQCEDYLAIKLQRDDLAKAPDELVWKQVFCANMNKNWNHLEDYLAITREVVGVPSEGPIDYYFCPSVYDPNIRITSAGRAVAALAWCFKEIIPTDEATFLLLLSRTLMSGVSVLVSSHIEHVRQMIQLRKYKEMLANLQRPLNNISSSLTEMQRDSQELRAVLYEPEEALFASYPLVEPFFRQGAPLRFPKTDLKEIRIQHSPGNYNDDDLRLVAAVVCASVFGEQGRLFECSGRMSILAEASDLMVRLGKHDPIRSLVKDFSWLVNTDTLSNLLHRRLDWTRPALETALNNTKAALFTPFKPDASEWPRAAIQLLMRNECFSGAMEAGRLKISEEIQKKETKVSSNKLSHLLTDNFPCTYAAVLTLLRDIAFVALGEKNAVQSLEYAYNSPDKSAAFTMRFQQGLGIDTNRVQTSCHAVMGSFVDWRLDGGNYGDLTRPFVLFANRLHGVRPVGAGGEWSLDEPTKWPTDTVIYAERKVGETKAIFSVLISNDVVKIAAQEVS